MRAASRLLNGGEQTISPDVSSLPASLPPGIDTAWASKTIRPPPAIISKFAGTVSGSGRLPER